MEAWTEITGNLKHLSPLVGQRVTIKKVMSNKEKMLVPVGAITSGVLQIVKRAGNPAMYVGSGDDYILTSPIQDVTKHGDDGFLILTQNSVYRLAV